MERDTTVFGLSVVLVFVGLAALLAGEYLSIPAAIYGGGTVILVGVGILTAGVANLEEAGDHGA